MGDADNNQFVVPIREIESWIEDTMSEMDEGLDGLFTFINVLKERTSAMQGEMENWRRFSLCFAAFNVFVLPVVLSICIAFGTCEVLGCQEAGVIQALLHVVIILLMLVAGFIGFPLYMYTVLDFLHSIGIAQTPTRVCSEMEINEEDGSVSLDDDIGLSIPPMEESQEGLSEFRRLVNRRITDNVRQHLERRINQSGQVEPSRARAPTPSRSETFKTEKDDVILTSGQHQNNLNSGFGVVLEEESKFRGVKLIILNQTPDLSVQVDKRRHLPSTTRDIAVETV